MMSRRAVGAVTAALLLLLATGCVPEPAPTPTPTGFATEEEAFAAAEETYRAYVDALNQVDLSDPDTFEPVFAWTTGELNANDRKNFTEWHAEGYQISGSATVPTIAPSAISSDPPPHVLIEACYDIRDVDVLDSAGNSIVAAERPDVQSLRISLVESESTPTSLAISLIEPAADLSC